MVFVEFSVQLPHQPANDSWRSRHSYKPLFINILSGYLKARAAKEPGDESPFSSTMWQIYVPEGLLPLTLNGEAVV
jgi:hypothetical protein